jgi:hypothetical protein
VARLGIEGLIESQYRGEISPALVGTSAPKGRASREVKQARSGDLTGADIGLATKPH